MCYAILESSTRIVVNVKGADTLAIVDAILDASYCCVVTHRVWKQAVAHIASTQ